MNDIASSFAIVAACAANGIKKAVLSPGSRSAPLILAFARHENIECFVVPDERAAGYLALGLAQSSEISVALVCTSGTAALNYAPAIAEAHYLHVPLIVLTADRPADLIDKRDGQTIHQNHMFRPYVLSDAIWPEQHTDRPEALCNLGDMIARSHTRPMGPSHLNIPLAEPLYPDKPEPFPALSPSTHCISSTLSACDADSLRRDVSSATSVMLLVGQLPPDEDITHILHEIVDSSTATVLLDGLSNQHECGGVPTLEVLLTVNPDLFQDTQPDLILTIGMSVLSKRLKKAIRSAPPEMHIHIEPGDRVFDTFDSLTSRVNAPVTDGLQVVAEALEGRTPSDCRWRDSMGAATEHLRSVINENPWGEMAAVAAMINALPKGSQLHLANSMSVRYGTLFSIQDQGINVWANRGTSGIDGCLATAVGHAIADERPHILIIGDMALQYGRNALWHKHRPENLDIIVLNNGGGGIFSLIEGPSDHAECDDFFVADNPMSSASIANDFGLNYIDADSAAAFEQGLKNLSCFGGRATVLEAFTSREVNRTVYDAFLKR